MITRKSSYLSYKSTSSTSRSPSPTHEIGWDADDEGQLDTMSSDDSTPSKPLSVAIPSHAPAYISRPGLREILANTAPPPWTLSAFMAYLSNNHCLETLEFTMDAGRYKKHYMKMMAKAAGKGSLSEKDANNIKVLWQRLVEAYIKPNGSREVNLPSEVRDPILNLDYSSAPPAPETLDPAVAKIYELMDDSVLVPFLNSLTPVSRSPAASPYGHPSHHTSHSFDDRDKSNRKSRFSHASPPAASIDVHPATYTSSSSSSAYRKSTTLNLGGAIKSHRFSRLSPTSSATSPGTQSLTVTKSNSSETYTSFPGLTDDSTSTSSPVNDSPMTPPTSPPIGEAAGSPRTSRDWKKFGRLSQWKPGRKKSQTFDETKTQ